MKRLETIVLARGLAIQARINHSGDAANGIVNLRESESRNAFDDRFAQRGD